MTFRSASTRLLTSGCAVTAGAVVLAACGSSGDDSKRLTKTAYISQSDAACAATNKLPQPKPAQDAAGATANANSEAQIRQQLVGKLGALKPPKALESAANTYIDQTKQIIVLYRKQAKDAPNYKLYIRDQFETDELAARREKTAYQVGYKVCGRPPGVDGSKFDPALIKQADAICRSANEAALSNTSAKPFGIDDLAALAKFYDASLPAAQATVAKLEALQPPPAAKANYATFAQAYAARIAITERQSKAAHANDKKAFMAATNDDGKQFQRESAAAANLGFEVCGNHNTNGV
jgi:hypothetical protein